MASNTRQTKAIRRRKRSKIGKRRKKEVAKRGTINYLNADPLPIVKL